MKIKSIRKIKSPLKVYDFTVEDVNYYLLSNGIVSHNSYVPTKQISGGGGVQYASSCILEIGKKKDKDGTDVIGNILTVKTTKSRYSKESQKVELKLDFTTGIDRYYGLLDLAEKYDIIKKVGNRYELPDGSKVWGKDIIANPEKYYTPDIMEKLEEAAKQEFSLGEVEEIKKISDDDIVEELESVVQEEE